MLFQKQGAKYPRRKSNLLRGHSLNNVMLLFFLGNTFIGRGMPRRIPPAISKYFCKLRRTRICSNCF